MARMSNPPPAAQMSNLPSAQMSNTPPPGGGGDREINHLLQLQLNMQCVNPTQNYHVF